MPSTFRLSATREPATEYPLSAGGISTLSIRPHGKLQVLLERERLRLSHRSRQASRRAASHVDDLPAIQRHGRDRLQPVEHRLVGIGGRVWAMAERLREEQSRRKERISCDCTEESRRVFMSWPQLSVHSAPEGWANAVPAGLQYVPALRWSTGLSTRSPACAASLPA